MNINILLAFIQFCNLNDLEHLKTWNTLQTFKADDYTIRIYEYYPEENFTLYSDYAYNPVLNEIVYVDGI